MKTKLITLCGAAAFAAASVATAAISITLELEVVKDSSDQPINNQGLLVLVVDTAGNGFSQPIAGEIVPAASDDEIVATWDLSVESIPVGQDYLQLLKSGIPYGGTWEAEQKLALMWFPGLADGETPAVDEEYGFFSDSLGLASGDAWSLPGDQVLVHSLKLFTSLANELVMFGDFPNAIGKAGFAINSALPANPTAVGAPNLAANDATIEVNWAGGSAPSGGYIVQRRKVTTPASGWTTVGAVDESGTSFVDAGTSAKLVAGLQYEYRVVSVNGLSYAASVEAAAEAERSIFTGIAARGYVDNSAPYTLLNGGIILVGSDPEKKIIASGIGPHNAIKLNQLDQWVEDPYLTHNLLGQAVDAENQDWIYDAEAGDGTNPNPDLQAIKDTFAAKPIVSELSDSPEVALDAVVLEDLPVNTNNIFKVQSIGADAGFVAIEVYDAEYPDTEGGPGVSDNRIYSISSRSWFPGTTAVPGAVSNASVTIEGDVAKEVLAIAQGPSILPTNPTSSQILHDPILRLQKPGVGLVFQNDDWNSQTAFTDLTKGVVRVETDMDRIRAALVANNHNPDNFTKDSVLLVTLQPGDYIFRAVPKDGTQQSD